jgi:capsular polysaccharide biosynthesis protein
MTERSFPEIGIADVAANIICLEVAEPWVCRSRVDLGPTFTDPAMQQFFGPVRQTLSVRNFLLRDVTLSAQWMLLWKDWCKIAETRNLIPDDVYDGLAIRGEDVAEVTSSAPVVIGFNKDWSGYYHWLVQCLPAIDSAERAQAQPMSLAVPAMTAWQSEYLSLLDCDWAQTIEIEPHREYRLQSAIYSEHLNGSTAWGISQTAIRTFARLRENAAVPPAAEELVYVSRIGSTRRRLLNEDEVIRFLETQGAKIADPGTLTPKEQISLFSGARIVIGPHGGGLTNLVFCKSNAAIYELLPSSYANVCYNRLAQANGMDYWADMFPAESKDDIHDI